MRKTNLIMHALTLLVLMLLVTACGDEEAPSVNLAAAGEACDADTACEAGLSCVASVCVAAEIDASGDPADVVGTDDASPSNDTEPGPDPDVVEVADVEPAQDTEPVEDAVPITDGPAVDDAQESSDLGETGDLGPAQDVTDLADSASVEEDAGLLDVAPPEDDAWDWDTAWADTAATGDVAEPGDAVTTELPEFSDAGIRIELTWTLDGELADTVLADLDLHFVHPYAGLDDEAWFDSPYDCHWNNPNPMWGSFSPEESEANPSVVIELNPEIIALVTPEEGLSYRIGVHNWNSASDLPEQPMATIRVFANDVLSYEVSDVSLTSGDLWDVGTVSWPEGLVTPSEGTEGGLRILPDFSNENFGSTK